MNPFHAHPSTRRWRLTLIALAIVVICGVLGKRHVDRARRQSAAVARVRKSLGWIRYSYLVTLPNWYVDRFGADLFATATGVSYFEAGMYPPDDPTIHGYFAALGDLPNLQEVDIFDSSFPIDVLEDLPSLKRLRIEQNGLCDNDVDVIARLTSLEELRLPFNDITDAGARKLAALTSLRELDLTGNYLSPAAVAHLEQTLPGCRVRSWHRRDGRFE